jgi:hypothetical protein
MREREQTAPACIVCGATGVEEFLDLGATGLANKFRTAAELATPEPKYPLRVGFCERCGHVQLMESVPPSAMFDDYLYVSAASDTLRNHLFELSDVVVERFSLDGDDLVIDIGANDGTLLTGFERHGVRTLGVDPARNLAALAGASEIDRHVGFFNSESATEIRDRWGKASVITATNTFPHIPNLDDFMTGITETLAPGGAFVLEAHYLVDMLDQAAFDTIYHEHVSYWALRPMLELFRRHGLEATNAERLPIHHGQLRVTAQRSGEGTVQPAVAGILAREEARELDRLSTFEQFADTTRRIKVDLGRTMSELRADGRRVAGYGAPAKGNTLISYLELGPDTVEYIADRSPLKQGLYTPNARIPVVPPERLLEDQPDYVLLLAWNFADEILEQQAEYRRRGGRFIIPIPEVEVV